MFAECFFNESMYRTREGKPNRFVPISEIPSVVASDLLHDKASVCDTFESVLSGR